MEENKITGKLVVIGGSSGSLDALMNILPVLHHDFSLPVVLVLHRGTGADGGLVELLSSKTLLKIKEADEKEMLLPGWIYIAPADYHLLIEEDGTLSLDVSEKVNYSRPSIDVTFSSAAAAYGSRLVAVLLSGANADGAMGMKEIHLSGGRNIVQDPADALVSYMPEQAIQVNRIDDVLNAKEIAALLNTIATGDQ